MSTTDTEVKKFAYIDSLRGLAFLGVLVLHATFYGTNDFPALTLAKTQSISPLGVQLFYIISAFTLFHSYYSRKTDQPEPLLYFFIRRFFRVAPLFYFMTMVVFWLVYGTSLHLPEAEQTAQLGAPMVASLLFLHGFSPHWIQSSVPAGWSLAIEMTFYCLLPFFFARIKTLYAAGWGIVFSLGLAGILNEALTRWPLIQDPTLWHDYLYFYFPSQLPSFMIGIALYFIIHGRPEQKNFQGRNLPLLLLLFTGFLTLHLFFYRGISLHASASFGLAIITYAVSLRPYRLIVNRFTVILGKLSYSLYLSHYLVLDLLDNYKMVDSVASPTLNLLLRIILALILSLGISTFTYALVEKPGIRLGKKLIANLRLRPHSKTTSLTLQHEQAS